MLGKLIKYDLRYVMRYLWILAVSSLGGAFIGGFSIKLINNSVSGLGGDLLALGVIGIMIAVLVLSAFALASAVFIFYRFNQNFYTDEGYLTFTLPVKKSELLLSKLISGIAVFSVSTVILFIDIVIMIAIGEGFESSGGTTVQDPRSPLLSAIYFVEGVTLVFAAAVLVTLLVFIFISLSSMLKKKHRIIIGVIVAYLLSGALSMLFSFAFGFGSRSIIDMLAGVDAVVQDWLSALMLLTVDLLLLMLCAVAYTAEYRILDKHLNLS